MKKSFSPHSGPEQSSRWLAYTQLILEKVSFDKEIFRKELRKSLRRLTATDIRRLEAWCINSLNLSLAVIAVQVIQEYAAMAM
ncbi:MAG: hypothetical protein KTR24_01390 [Saprospiraceae bacterium]|nr:hypothetical protein [Saprospiraceae bacterium]